MARGWYTYMGGDYTLVDNYLAASTTPTCRAGRRLCAVYATNSNPKGMHPEEISFNIQFYIADGYVNGGLTPTTPGGAKRYAYFFQKN